MGPTQYPGERLQRETLGIAIELADEAVAGRRLARAQYAALVAELYEALLDGWPIGALVAHARGIADEHIQDSARRARLPGIGYLRVVV